MIDQLTEEDLDTFATKLEAFGQQLSPKERTILEAILAAASESSGTEIKGYSLGFQRGAMGDAVRSMGGGQEASGRSGPTRDSIISLIRGLTHRS